MIGFSVLGWNARQFAAVAETVKQVNPDAVVVFGGNHVAHQAERVLSGALQDSPQLITNPG